MIKVSLIGRPNVGKSTIFNRLTHTRNALVLDMPGVTRDRHYGILQGNSTSIRCQIIDTGGMVLGKEEISKTAYADDINKQAKFAIEESDIALVVMNAQERITQNDEDIIKLLRKSNTKFIIVVNKIDSVEESIVQEFYNFGVEIHPLCATNRRGITRLKQKIILMAKILLNKDGDKDEYKIEKENKENDDEDDDKEEINTEKTEDEIIEEKISNGELIDFALVGRPNVGKSTLSNRIIGYDRFITADDFGTTVDSQRTIIKNQDKEYVLIDTAGMRKKGNIKNLIETFSVLKAQAVMKKAKVAVIMFDAQMGIVEQDIRLLKLAIDMGKAFVLLINKCDTLDKKERKQIEEMLEHKLHSKVFFNIHYISALKDSNLYKIFHSIDQAHRASNYLIDKVTLQEAIERLVANHHIPMIGSRQIKIKYTKQIETNPPTFAIFGNQLIAKMPKNYVSYLVNSLRDMFGLKGTTIKMQIRWQENPYQKQNESKKTEAMKHKKEYLL